MMYIKGKIFSWLLRSFQKEISTLNGTLTKEQYDGLLSQMYQNQAFRNYIYKRENAIILGMANDVQGKLNRDIEQGRRLELANLLNESRLAYNRTVAPTKEQSNSASSQAQA